MDTRKLIPLNQVMEKLQLSRSSINKMVKEGTFKKYTFPHSNKVYLDENQIAEAFIPKR